MDIRAIKHLVKTAHEAGQKMNTDIVDKLVADYYVENLFSSDLVKKQEIHNSDLGVFKISDIVAISPMRINKDNVSFDIWLKGNVMLSNWQDTKDGKQDELSIKRAALVDVWSNCL